jgi:transcription elongation factor Elf1
MSRSHKFFIDFSDLLAVRFECPNCNSSTTVPLRGEHRGMLNSCANCGIQWKKLEQTGTPLKDAVGRFMDAVRDVERIAGDNKLPLTFEIHESVLIKPETK